MRRFFLMLAVSSCAVSYAQVFTQVDLGEYNYDYRTLTGLTSNFPVGPTVLGGVEFAIPVSGNNVWASSEDANSTLTVSGLQIEKATKLHLLVNTFWGNPGGTATLTVTGSDGTIVTRTLSGGSEMRDYREGNYTNSINGTTTQNVYIDGSGFGVQVRLDKHVLELGPEFQNESIAQIQLVDNGSNFFSRTFTAGMTVEAVPEPGTLAAVGFGLAALARKRRK